MIQKKILIERVFGAECWDYDYWDCVGDVVWNISI